MRLHLRFKDAFDMLFIMPQSLGNSQPHHFGKEERQFKELAEKYAAALKAMHTRCIPYDDATLPLFSKAKSEAKLAALAFLENALAVFEEVRMAGGDLRDNRTLIWRIINRLKLIPDSAIFDKMGDDDVIEIYSLPDHSHLAWNIQLMERVSFTVEQLLCQPWWELSSRPMEVMSELQRLAILFATNEQTTTVIPAVPRHHVQELQSHELLTLEMDIKFVSPLRQAGRNAAFLVVIGSQIIGSQKKDEPNSL